MSRDLTLVRAWLAGDIEARERLFNESYVKVLKWVATKIQPTSPNYRDLVYEIAHEAFSRAFEKLEDYNGSSLFGLRTETIY